MADLRFRRHLTLPLTGSAETPDMILRFPYRGNVATLKKNKLTNGCSYTIEWRSGGARDGQWCHETFKTEPEAKFFKLDVERHRHQYPPNYLKKVGYVDPQVLAEEKARVAADAAEAARVKPVYFRDRFEAFLKTRSGIEERTIQDYAHQYANHFEKPFGGLVVNEAAQAAEDDYWDGDKVKAWVTETEHGVRDPETHKWIKKPRSAKTVRNLHALLSSYGAWLVEKKLRSANPCSGTNLPEPEEGDADIEMVFLERDEYKHLLGHFHEQEARDLVEFLAGTGARYGEATALKIKDLKLDRPNDTPHLMIRRAWKRQPNGSHKEGRPKSKASRRRVDLDANEHVVDLLKRIIRGRSPEEYVFLTPTGVHWRHANFYNRPWLQGIYSAARCEHHRLQDGITNMHDLKRRHVKPCGCPGTMDKVPRIHDLRHSNASWLIEAGVSLVAIQRQFGHESYHTTEKRYAHLTAGTRRQMGAAANAILRTAAADADFVGVAAALSTRHRHAEKRLRRQRAFGPRGVSLSGTGAR